MNIQDELRKTYGKYLPEGDGWSWEWEIDELAEKAAKYITELEAKLNDSQ